MAPSLKRKQMEPTPVPLPGQPTWPIPDPAKPSALLLPPFVFERQNEARVRRLAIRVAVGAVAALAAATAGTNALAWKATQEMNTTQEQFLVQQAKKDKYVEIANYYDGLTQRREFLTQRLSNALRYSAISGAVLDAAPGSVSVDSMTFEKGVTCPGPDPFTSVQSQGCITITGTSSGAAGVSSFVDSLNDPNASQMVGDAFVSSMTGGESSISFDIPLSPPPRGAPPCLQSPPDPPQQPSAATPRSTPTTGPPWSHCVCQEFADHTKDAAGPTPVFR